MSQKEIVIPNNSPFTKYVVMPWVTSVLGAEGKILEMKTKSELVHHVCLKDPLVGGATKIRLEIYDNNDK